jgi:UDP-N-acetylglucosamine:LPS N-acetylglucosamine transferase
MSDKPERSDHNEVNAALQEARKGTIVMQTEGSSPGNLTEYISDLPAAQPQQQQPTSQAPPPPPPSTDE